MVHGSDDSGLKNKVFGWRTGEGDGRIERRRGLGMAERRERMIPIYMSDEFFFGLLSWHRENHVFRLAFIDRYPPLQLKTISFSMYRPLSFILSKRTFSSRVFSQVMIIRLCTSSIVPFRRSSSCCQRISEFSLL